MWIYMQRILIPYQEQDARLHDRPRGVLSDLYPRWYGSRELVLHHRDPYSRDVTLEIQQVYYGRALDPRRPNDPTDEQRFAYPVYVAFLLSPTLSLPFEVVQTGFRWLLVALTAASVLLWLRVVGWKPSCSGVFILLVLTLGSLPAAQGIKLQQLTLLVAAFLAVAAVLAACNRLLLAGMFMALATIKPQLALLPTAWFLLWSFADWHRRQKFVWGFSFCLLALVLGGELLLPGWIPRFYDAVAAYRHYTGAQSLLDVLLTPWAGGVLGAMISLAFARVAWRMRRIPANDPGFAFMASLVLAVTVLIVPMTAPYNQLLLLPAVFLIVRDWNALWKGSRLLRASAIIGICITAWPWAATFVLMILLPVVSSACLQRAWAVPLYTSLAVPLILNALLIFLAPWRLRRSIPASASELA
jgi:hypothetical protein